MGHPVVSKPNRPSFHCQRLQLFAWAVVIIERLFFVVRRIFLTLAGSLFVIVAQVSPEARKTTKCVAVRSGRASPAAPVAVPAGIRLRRRRSARGPPAAAAGWKRWWFGPAKPTRPTQRDYGECNKEFFYIIFFKHWGRVHLNEGSVHTAESPFSSVRDAGRPASTAEDKYLARRQSCRSWRTSRWPPRRVPPDRSGHHDFQFDFGGGKSTRLYSLPPIDFGVWPFFGGQIPSTSLTVHAFDANFAQGVLDLLQV